MKDFPGTPGTLTGLLLRISQFVFAAGSIASMASTSSFFNFTAFWYCLVFQSTDFSLKVSNRLERWVFEEWVESMPLLNLKFFLLWSWNSVGFVWNPKDDDLTIILAVQVSNICSGPFICNSLFCSYLIASMGLQVIWSFVLALLDAYSLMKKKALHNPLLVSLFVVGDWVSLYKPLTFLIAIWILLCF